MLTRIERRLYGSVHVGSITSASMPRARAARAIAPRFSASFRPSSTARRVQVGGDVVERPLRQARAPRRPRRGGGRSPPHSVITSRSATYTGTPRAASSSSRARKRSTRDGASSTDRISCSESMRRSMATNPSAMNSSSPSNAAAEGLVVQRPVVVEAWVVAGGHRIAVAVVGVIVSERRLGNRRRTT